MGKLLKEKDKKLARRTRRKKKKRREREKKEGQRWGIRWSTASTYI